MSTKHIDTAADLVRFGASVKIECGSCGAARTVDGAAMVKLCGSGSLRLARARLKCDRCQAKAARLVVLPPLWIFLPQARTSRPNARSPIGQEASRTIRTGFATCLRSDAYEACFAGGRKVCKMLL